MDAIKTREAQVIYRRRFLTVIALGVSICILGLYTTAKSTIFKNAFDANHTPIHRFTDRRCKAAYLAFFKNKTIQIRILFGYKDASPARFVADRYEHAIFVQSILRTCTDQSQDCGFQFNGEFDRDGEQIYSKVFIGPDGLQKQINLSINPSSVGPDDLENRKNIFQKWKSQFAERRFIDGLKEADVVFYNGHSRSGGGPDFFPPKKDTNGHVNYAWYQSNQPGLTTIESTLHQSTQVRILALFSCKSETLFSLKIKKAKKNLCLLSNRKLIYFSDAIDHSLNALSGLLEMKCKFAPIQILRPDELAPKKIGGAA